MRSLAHALERLGLALLVGGACSCSPPGCSTSSSGTRSASAFVPAHYYGAFVFIAALAFHVGIKLPVARRAFAERGVLAPLRDDLEHTEPEPGAGRTRTSAPHGAAAPTLTPAGCCSAASARRPLGLALMATGQVVGGPLAELACWRRAGAAAAAGPTTSWSTRPSPRWASR